MGKGINDKNNRKKSVEVITLIITTIILIYVYIQFDVITNDKLLLFNEKVETAQEVPYRDFVKKAYNGEVDTLWYNTNNEKMVYVLYTDESKGMTKEEKEKYEYPEENYFVTGYPSGETFRAQMLQYNINLVLVRESTAGYDLFNVALMLSPLIFLIIFLMYARKSLPGIGNDMQASNIIQTSDVSMDDIIGLDEIKDELKLIVNIIKDPDYGKNFGVKPPAGIILSGQSGVGKTMIAKAISHDAGVPFISVNGSDFQQIYVGNGAKRVRELFKIASDNAPCIIFIDEFDGLAEKRDSYKSAAEDTRTIDAILKELDGFKDRGKVFVLAATNHPEKLDSAITRSGRFDREIIIGKPRDWETRKLLFNAYLKDKPLAEDVDLDAICRATAGFTGADIATVCNEAAIVALSKELGYITHECIEEAIDKKILKGSRSKCKVNEKDKKIVSYHEAGHAIMCYLLKMEIARASVLQTTSGVGGMVMHEDSGSQFMTRKEMGNRIMVAYAGRISEEIEFDTITTGASNDITNATQLLNEYVNRFGFHDDSGLIDLSVIKSEVSSSEYTEETVRALSKEFYGDAYEILSKNYNMVEALAEKLTEVGVMSGSEIKEFLSAYIIDEEKDTTSFELVDNGVEDI